MEDKIRCPKCGSTQIVANKRGFAWIRFILITIFTLGLGLIFGFIGRNKIEITCLNCGHKFKPRQGAKKINKGSDINAIKKRF